MDEDVDSDGDLSPDCTDEDDDDDGFADLVDCGPTDPATYPNAAESCDAVDSDCDGSVTDEFTDTDGDGIPDCIEDDSDGDGDPDDTDCEPLDPAVHSAAIDTPDDDIDQDCDGFDATACWLDADGDGFGGAEPLWAADGDCDDSGESAVGTDCDDGAGGVHPGAQEVCNSTDDDCDAATDELVDSDGDGYTICDGDCAEFDDTVHPGASEECDGLDTDCDPSTLEDATDSDGDGFRLCDGDCDDADGTTYPGAPELCDGLDNDCDGGPESDAEVDFVDWYLDADGDGFGDAMLPHSDNPLCDAPDGYVTDDGDCADDDPSVFPGAEERCNGEDDDCFAATDLDGTDEDSDGDGVLACNGDCDDADLGAFPGASEDCADDTDQDCDGTEALVGEDPECLGEGCGCSFDAMDRGAGRRIPTAVAFCLLVVGLWRGRRR